MERDNYKPIALCDTKNMSRNDWLNLRQDYIGGSDTAALLDLSPWKTSIELYHQKTGRNPAMQVERNQSNKDAGSKYEEFVILQFITQFEKRYGEELVYCDTIAQFNELPNAIIRDTHFYLHGKRDADGNLLYPFAAGNIDAIMKYHGRIGVVEAKTFNVDSKYGRKTKKVWENGQVPIYYEYQGRYYMSILNVDYCFFACAYGFLAEQFFMVKIDRDYEIEDTLMETCKKFYIAVRDKSGWDASKCNTHLLREYYNRLHGEIVTSKFVNLDPCWYSLMEKFYSRQEKRNQLNKQLQEMDQKDDELLSILLPVIENAGYVSCRKGTETIKLTVKTPMKVSRCVNLENQALAHTARINWEGLQEDYPDIWKECQTTTFDPKKLKTFHPDLFRKYELPAEPTGDLNKFEATKINL